MRRTCLDRTVVSLIGGRSLSFPDQSSFIRTRIALAILSHGRCTRAGPPVGTPLVGPGLEAALSGLTFRQPSAASVPGLVHAILGVSAQLPTRGGAESHGRMDQAKEKLTAKRLSFG